MEQSRTYHSFLFTAWQEGIPEDDTRSAWRFGLEDARGIKRRRVFATLKEVMSYVEEELVVEEIQDPNS